MSMSPAAPFPLSTPPRRRLGLRLSLPLMALGVAALVPGRLAGLAALWPPGPSALRAQTASPPMPQPMPQPVLAPRGPVALREGVVATPTVSSTLAGPIRPNPLGDSKPGEARLLIEVSRRQADIDRREQALDLREAKLQAAEGMARQQIAELIKLRQEIEQLVVRESHAADADIDALVALYVNMKPLQAAKVLERLEPPRAAAILLKIPDRQAGPILAQMEPPAALAVTQEIAGRREAFRPPPAP